jgi:hypothetical protein
LGEQKSGKEVRRGNQKIENKPKNPVIDVKGGKYVLI